MELIELSPIEKPQFDIDAEVWIIRNKKPKKQRVVSIFFELIDAGEEKPVLVHRGYQLDAYNLDASDIRVLFEPSEVYADKCEAEKLSTWHPVNILSAAEWRQAIGDQDLESQRESDLSLCCAHVDAIRNILARCQEDGGLIERDAQRLEQLLEEHGYDADDSNVLKGILTELGI